MVHLTLILKTVISFVIYLAHLNWTPGHAVFLILSNLTFDKIHPS